MGGLRILHVEDDELNQALVRAIVARSADPAVNGAHVVAAGSLALARAALAGGAFDVVLLDMRLPDGSGLDLAAEIQQGGRASPAVIALSGAAAEQSGAALAAGCVAVLGKPYSPAYLSSLLGSYRPGQHEQ